MDTLAAWRDLLTAPPPARLAAALREAAAVPEFARRPFLALALTHANHPDPDVRAATLKPLAGRLGFPAVRRIVAALDDPEPAVFREAVLALAATATAGADPDRMAHAVFHPNPLVRRAAADVLPPAAGFLRLYLLADPDTRAAVLPGLADVTPQPWQWPTILAAVEAGHLPKPVAATLVGRVSWATWLAYFVERPGRTADQLAPVWARFDADPLAAAPPSPADPLDAFFALLCEAADAGVRAILRAVPGETPQDHEPRVAAAAVAAQAGRREWDPDAARVVAAFWPNFLLRRTVPEPVRRAAAAVFLDVPEAVAGRWRGSAAYRLGFPATLREEGFAGGSLDLDAYAGPLRVCDRPFESLADVFGWDAVVAAAGAADWGRLAPLFASADRFVRQDFFEVCRSRGEPGLRRKVLRGVARFAGDEAAGTFERADPDVLDEYLAELAGLRCRPEPLPLADLAVRFGHKALAGLGGRVPAAFLRAWATSPAPLASPAVLGLVNRLAFLVSPAELSAAVDGIEEPTRDTLRGLLKAIPAFDAGDRRGLPGVLAGRFPDAPQAREVLARALAECGDPLADVDAFLAKCLPDKGWPRGCLDSRYFAAVAAAPGWPDRPLVFYALAADAIGTVRPLDGFRRRVRENSPAVVLRDLLAAKCDPVARGGWRLAAAAADLDPESWRTAEVASVLADALTDKRAAPHAAAMLGPWAGAAARRTVADRWFGIVAAYPEAVGVLGPWLSAGLPRPAGDPVLADLAVTFDPDLLKRSILGAASPAVLDRLLALGPGGRKFAAELVRTTGDLAATAPAWPKGAWLAWARAVVADPTEPDELRFRAGQLLVARGEKEWLPALAERLADPAAAWATSGDVGWLAERTPDEVAFRVRLLAGSVTAATAALSMLMKFLPVEPRVRDAVVRTLATRTDLPHGVRSEAQNWAIEATPEAERFAALPALFKVVHKNLLVGMRPEFVAALVDACLADAANPVEESMLVSRLAEAAPLARAAGEDRLFADAAHPATVEALRPRLADARGRRTRLGHLADVFAWGVHEARKLLGRGFTVRPTDGRDLGYTRLTEDVVYVTPSPILQSLPHADAVTEGLIVHELGHHLYHRGPDTTPVFQQAQQEKLKPLLNLVADEHLERNLRAKSAAYGDRLKVLNAFASNRHGNEVAVQTLLAAFGPWAAAALAGCRLAPARQKGRVRVSGGGLLRELDRAGSSFARFFRALRMGLGNRAGDPKVAAGLALFQGARFRRLTLPEQLALARRLREMFGTEADVLLDCMAPGPGEFVFDDRPGDGSLTAAEAEDLKHDIDGRVRRFKGHPHTGAGGKGGGGNWLNVNEEEQFNTIDKVQPVTADPAAQAAAAARVARPARLLREYLQRLAGARLAAQRFRSAGHRLDRGRLKAATQTRDPRVLIARAKQPAADLFLGVVVDCSGSMSGPRIEKARLFGTLVAEAVRGLPWVDFRAWGFTSAAIYDAGTAKQCRIAGLQAGGGNNDAAALWHAAQAALRSRRRTKLLMMISDGLPTECSVAALRGLVKKLTRRHKIACAQVAVHPIEEVCFPHYVELRDQDLTAAVRAFGATVLRLVRLTLGTG